MTVPFFCLLAGHAMSFQLIPFWTILFLTLIGGGWPSTGWAVQSDDPWSAVVESMEYRLVGPFRGGRSCAVVGVPQRPFEFYFGSTGGGVWKTTDGGSSWDNVSDGFFGGSIGCVAIAPSDSDVIYVGTGEKTVRGNVSHGDGAWKSIDGGKTWQSIGLEDSRHISRIRIHPTNPDVAYAAVMGHLFGPNQQRGVFKTVDGGKTWERVLFVNEEVGAVDLAMDPQDSQTLYASTWRILRTPYSLESGGQGCGLHKSTDGGKTWQELHTRDGFAKGTLGIIGVTVSPVDPQRVWALVEAKDGGLFRSDNGGQNWQRINQDRNLRQRAWYYTRLQASPENRDTLFVMNVGFWKSTDGGVDFSSIRTPHSDHHDLWIDSTNPQRMIVGDDGGAQVTFNGGDTWSEMDSQPTAQFYRVTTDDHFPFRIYGAQQDNSTVRILHHNLDGRGIGEREWESTAGGESGHIAVDPTNNDIVYGGSYGGYLERVDHATGQRQVVTVWPDNPIGRGAGDTRYRFQWNFPIFFSPHNPKQLYAAGNVLFRSEDEGRSWTAISPDLTRNDPRKLGSSGGPITKDNTGVETYCTIFAALESPHQAGVIWAGSDDGKLHVTQDDGENWEDVTPPSLPDWSQINSIEAHPTQPGGLYVAATRYKLDDFKPYLFKTMDFGKTWTQIDDGIPRDHFTRVVRADKVREGLLFAGTESGMYVSLNDGKSWRSFQQNLPQVPITDLAWKDKSLIVATQGRAFWMIDDLSRMHQWEPEMAKKSVHVFQPSETLHILTRGGRGRDSGTNKSTAPTLDFYLSELPEEDQNVVVTIQDPSGNTITEYARKPDEEKKQEKLNLKSGMNSLSWNMRYPSAETFDGLVLWLGGTQGPQAVPGTYPVILEIGDQTYETQFVINPDPRSQATPEDYQAQLDYLLGVRDKLSEVHLAIQHIRDARAQLESLEQRIKRAEAQEEEEQFKELNDIVSELKTSIREVEEALYQTNNESPQDPLNYPIRLNNRLSALVSVVQAGNNAPTEQAETFRKEITEMIDTELAKLKEVVTQKLPALNEAVFDAKIPAVFWKEN